MKIFAVVATALAASSPAVAADVAPLVAPAPAVPYNWSGPYVGVNAGGGFAAFSETASLAGVSASASETLTGVLGGGQVGANYQFGLAVLGAEADLQGTLQSNSVSLGGLSATDSMPWFGTVRVRGGLGLDRWLLYVTGGWGYGGFSSKATLDGSTIYSLTSSHDVWTIGAGIEVGIWGGLSMRVEYLLLDTGTVVHNYSTVAGTLTTNATLIDNVFRVGLNYRF